MQYHVDCEHEICFVLNDRNSLEAQKEDIPIKPPTRMDASILRECCGKEFSFDSRRLGDKFHAKTYRKPPAMQMLIETGHKGDAVADKAATRPPLHPIEEVTVTTKPVEKNLLNKQQTKQCQS
ncbi:unnamed protein product [Rodentolepis nana]|uniref:Uncharacterized protein n=1 Tax=Rodentolepis nana TaxID=102285 RepID=A0A3P7SP31_RODNA|nr:unnamed protein product [Rodentolepis nana]